MALLQNLPEEILVEILSCLPLRTVETVAWILNHPITEICISLLQPVFKARRDTKRLLETFGPYNNKHPYNGYMFPKNEEIPAGYRELLGLSAEDSIKAPASSIIPDLEYLELCGDLKWLHPLPEGIAKMMAPHDEGPAVTGRQYDDLILSAKRADVKLPTTFLTFIQDETLQKRIASVNAGYFALGKLEKVPKGQDGGIGGYRISFFWDQQGCYGLYLYLEPGMDGASCVLLDSGHNCKHDAESCPEVSQEDLQVAERVGLEVMRTSCLKSTLVGIDFEAWLAAMYYNEILWFVSLGFSNDIVQGLGEYVRRMIAMAENDTLAN